MAVISINWKPSDRDLRWFAIGQFLGVGFIAAELWVYLFGYWKISGLMLAASAIVAISGLVLPQSIRWVYVGWMVAVFPIGWVISHLLLAAIFFGVIMPIGLILRVLGRDPMQKSFDRSASTYWISRPTEPTDSQRYFRQF